MRENRLALSLIFDRKFKFIRLRASCAFVKLNLG